MPPTRLENVDCAMCSFEIGERVCYSVTRFERRDCQEVEEWELCHEIREWGMCHEIGIPMIQFSSWMNIDYFSFHPCIHAQSTHCTKNPIYVSPEMKLHGLVSTSYIHVTVSDLYIPRIGLHIGRPIPESIE